MKKGIKTLCVLLAVLFTKESSSQTLGSKPRPSISIGAELGIPTGDFSETSKLGLGGSAKLALPVGSTADVTISAGYISFSGKDYDFGGISLKIPAINLIPLKAGFRYRFSGGFYIEPQAGYTIFRVKDADESEGAFTYAGNLGYLINNKWDISARYEAATKEGETVSHAGLRVAYNLPF